jgi:hypothetical protein
MIFRVEIACDESGFSGSNLVAGPDTLLAHASVHIDEQSADALVQRVRRQIRAPEGELKAAQLLRDRHRPVVTWLVSAESPLLNHSLVHLTETRSFVLARLADLLLASEPVNGTDTPGRSGVAQAAAYTLTRDGPLAFGADLWRRFLRVSANLLRTSRRWPPRQPVVEFLAVLDALPQSGVSAELTEVIMRLRAACPVIESRRKTYVEDPNRTPLREPLIPALTRTVLAWGSTDHDLSVVHDEQSALTRSRIADITAVFARAYPGRQLSVRRVDSRDDARIQVADVLAGLARRVTSAQLAGRADGELSALLQPMIDPESILIGDPPPRTPSEPSPLR